MPIFILQLCLNLFSQGFLRDLLNTGDIKLAVTPQRIFEYRTTIVSDFGSFDIFIQSLLFQDSYLYFELHYLYMKIPSAYQLTHKNKL